MELRKTKQNAVVQGISFEDRKLLRDAKKRAVARRRSLSAYICDLVVDDLKQEEAHAN